MSESISELCDKALEILSQTKAILQKKDAKIEMDSQSLARVDLTNEISREVDHSAGG